MPYQCLEKCGEFLVAARDSSIDLFNLSNGEYISSWSCPLTQTPAKGKPNGGESSKKQEVKESPLVVDEVDASAPPAKRRKIETEDEKKTEEKVEEKPEPKVENKVVNENGGKKQQKKQKQNHRTDSIATGLEPPSVIALAVAKNAQYVVAITGEDKCIRVFEVITKDGKAILNHLSQR